MFNKKIILFIDKLIGFRSRLLEANKFIDEYIKICQNQLDGIKFRDSYNQKDSFRLFTDEQSLIEWFKSDRSTMVLLETDGIESKKCIV